MLHEWKIYRFIENDSISNCFEQKRTIFVFTFDTTESFWKNMISIVYHLYFCWLSVLFITLSNLWMMYISILNHLTGNASQSGEDNTNPKFWKTEKRVRFFIRRICKTSAWFWFVIVLVFLNTCTIAVQHYDQPLWLEEFLCKLIFLYDML